MFYAHDLHKLTFALLSASLLNFVACNGDDDDDDDDDDGETPTPTPTEVSDYRVTSMVVGDSSQGVDLTGDGEVDNSIDAALAGAQTAVYNSVDLWLDEQEVPPSQQLVILESVNMFLQANLTVETLSNAIDRPIENGATHYLMSFEETPTPALVWYLAEFQNTFYQPGQELGRQERGTGSTYGPGTLTLKLTLSDPRDPEQDVEIDLILHDGLTIVPEYGDDTLRDIRTGGAVAIEDVAALVGSLLTRLDTVLSEFTNPQTGEPIDLPVEDMVAELETQLEVYADIDLDDDGTFDSVSIGLLVDADSVPVED